MKQRTQILILVNLALLCFLGAAILYRTIQATPTHTINTVSGIPGGHDAPTNTITTPASSAQNLTPIPTTVPPTRSTPTPKPTAAPSFHTCTAQSCSNPWGFVLGCACGNMWQPVSIAPSGFCSWFACIPNFSAGSGNILECGDGLMSHALPGNCAGHDGSNGGLYVEVTVTPTP